MATIRAIHVDALRPRIGWRTSLARLQWLLTIAAFLILINVFTGLHRIWFHWPVAALLFVVVLRTVLRRRPASDSKAGAPKASRLRWPRLGAPITLFCPRHQALSSWCDTLGKNGITPSRDGGSWFVRRATRAQQTQGSRSAFRSITVMQEASRHVRFVPKADMFVRELI